MTWVFYSVKDGILRYFVEHYTVCLLLIKTEHLTQVPRDSLSLAVFIGCEPYCLRFLCVGLQVADNLLLIFRYLVIGLQRILVDAYLLLLKVADVSVARHHFVFFS